MRNKLTVIALLAFFMAAPAYPQSKEIQTLMRDVIDLNTRLKLLQTSVDENNGVIKGLVEKIADQVNTLSVSMKSVAQAVESTKTQNDGISKELRGNLTNLNNAVGELQKEVSALRGQVGAVSKQVTNLQTTAEPLPGPDDLWRSAMTDFLTGGYGLALGGFQEFLAKYPGDSRVGDAQYYIGEVFFNQKKYDQAVTQYDIVLQKFPESDKTRSALYKKGLAQAEQNQPQAVVTLMEVVKKFPNTSEAQNAQAKIKELQRPAARGKPAQ